MSEKLHAYFFGFLLIGIFVNLDTAVTVAAMWFVVEFCAFVFGRD